MADTLEDSAPVRLRHEGIPCSGPAALVPVASELLVEGIDTGDACMFLGSAEKIRAVRGLVGDAAGQVSFFDMSVQGRNPARVLPALQSFVDGHSDQRLRVIAEPVHRELSDAARAEAELGELLFGLATYRLWSGTVSCLYDSDALTHEATRTFETNHRDDLAAEDVESMLVKRFAEPLPMTPSNAHRLAADVTTLSYLRGAVSRFAADAGLDAERVDDLVYAVNEVVTNSICHGEGRARVALWRDADAVLCEVFDRGRIYDPLVGRIAPRPGQLSGRGLWLVNQLCDLVQVRSSAAGTFVRMSVDF